MSIEKDIGRIADALERLAGLAPGATAPPAAATTKPAGKGKGKEAAPSTKTPAPGASEEAPKLGQPEMASWLRKLYEAKGRDAAVNLLKKHGAKSISTLDSAKYPEVVKEIEKLVAEK